MNALIGEFIGTCMLVFLGEAACCDLLLSKSGLKTDSKTPLLLAWGTAVMVPAFIFGDLSGSHFNPAITIASAVCGHFDWANVPGYVVAQMLGGFLGAVLVIAVFHEHIKADEDDITIRSCFCTAPSIPNVPLNFLSEFLGTFVLVFALSSVPENAVDSGMKWMCVYCVIVILVASLGGVTGAALNAARDTAPRIAFALFCPGKFLSRFYPRQFLIELV